MEKQQHQQQKTAAVSFCLFSNGTFLRSERHFLEGVWGMDGGGGVIRAHRGGLGRLHDSLPRSVNLLN